MIDSEVSFKVVPTCTEPGVKVWTVDYNGNKISREDTVEALGHTKKFDYPRKQNFVYPTCTEDGSYEYVVYCADCGKELSCENKTVDALGHKEVDVEAVAPTCTKAGLTAGKKCETCGEVAKATVSVKVGKKSFTVKYSAKNATGYRVFYKKSTWKKYKSVTVGTISSINKTIKNRSKGKYYVKVQAYAKNYAGDKAVVWGTTSATKSVKVK